MEPVVRTLILQRFRSVRSAMVSFDNPTFLVGRNGSGKSNLLDAFAFLAEAMVSPLQAVFDRRGGISVVRSRIPGGHHPPKLGVAVVLGAMNGETQSGRYAFEIRALPNYGFEVLREQCRVVSRDGRRAWFDRVRGKFDSNVKGLDPSLEAASLGLPVVGGDARFAPVLRALAGMRTYAIEPAKLREMRDPDAGVSLRRDGGNAASVLQEVERRAREADVERICEVLGTIVPHTVAVHPKKHGNKLSLEFQQEWGEDRKRVRFDAFSMSDGTLRAVGLLTAVYQNPAPSVLAVEEPEATIHPGALGAVLDLLRHASRGMQVIVSTHSPEVLDEEWIQDNHLRIVDWQEGATRVAPVSEASRRALQEHLMGAGELLRSNALDPEPLFQDAADLKEGGLFEDVAA
ncbi:MAG: hypothetical protein FJ290_16350 [Planctomycetes bacterium]|nr:hypothetical protein [Planctomycetota bacterium]